MQRRQKKKHAAPKQPEKQSEKQPQKQQQQQQKPSVAGMTVQQERAALAEIRRQGEDISPHYVLKQVDMKAGDFALAYIMGQHAKRQDKHQRQTRAVNPCTGDRLATPSNSSSHHYYAPEVLPVDGEEEVVVVAVGPKTVLSPAADAGPPSALPGSPRAALLTNTL